MIRSLKSQNTNEFFQHDDNVSLATIKVNRPIFFQNRNKGERYQVYKGFLILRVGQKTAIHAYVSKDNNNFLVGINQTPKDLRDAKKLIDRCLDQNSLHIEV